MAPRASSTAATTETIEEREAPIFEVDEAIGSVERLYEALTGQSPPPEGERSQAPIPVERDPAEFVQGQLDRLMRALDRPAAAGFPATWLPPLAAWEDDRELVLALDLPGVSRGELEVTLEGDILSVSGRRVVRTDGHRLRLNERPLGSFYRSVVLPRSVGPFATSAQLKDGVLEIRLTKVQESLPQRRTIPVT